MNTRACVKQQQQVPKISSLALTIANWFIQIQYGSDLIERIQLYNLIQTNSSKKAFNQLKSKFSGEIQQSLAQYSYSLIKKSAIYSMKKISQILFSFEKEAGSGVLKNLLMLMIMIMATPTLPWMASVPGKEIGLIVSAWVGSYAMTMVVDNLQKNQLQQFLNQIQKSFQSILQHLQKFNFEIHSALRNCILCREYEQFYKKRQGTVLQQVLQSLVNEINTITKKQIQSINQSYFKHMKEFIMYQFKKNFQKTQGDIQFVLTQEDYKRYFENINQLLTQSQYQIKIDQNYQLQLKQ